jgi:hypothetical protein
MNIVLAGVVLAATVAVLASASAVVTGEVNAEYPHGKRVHVLTQENFDTTVTKGNWFIKFFGKFLPPSHCNASRVAEPRY